MASTWMELGFTQLWQLSAVAVTALLLSWLFRRASSYLHFAIWLLVIVKSLTPPLLTSSLSPFCWAQAEPAIQAPVKQPNEQPNSSDIHILPEADWSISHLPEDEPIASPAPNLNFSPSHQAMKTPSIKVDQGASRGNFTPISLTLVWILGTAIYFGVQLTRYRRIHQSIVQRTIRASTDDEMLFQRLKDRLRIRRIVALRVSHQPVCPFVVGLLRPTVIVPACWLRNADESSKLTVFAHELIHVRRGDLLLSWLQLVAQAIWWFHPLVHLASRKLRHAMELCCDENVIAETKCKPGEYARDLIGFLEYRNLVRPAAAFPSMSTAEITTRRMEKIMDLRNGSRKRVPWWIAIVLLVGGVLVVPGGALTFAETDTNSDAQERSQDQQNSTEKMAPAMATRFRFAPENPQPLPPHYLSDQWIRLPSEPLTGLPLNGTLMANDRTVLAESTEETYELHDAIDRLIADEVTATRAEAIEHLKRFFTGADTTGSVTVDGEVATVCCPADNHEYLRTELEMIARYGFKVIGCQILVAKASTETLKEFTADWEWVNREGGFLDQSMDPSDDRREIERSGQATGSVRRYVETTSVLRKRIIDSDDFQDFVDELSTTDHFLLTYPQTTTLNGRTARILVGHQQPFVVGGKKLSESELQPIIRVVNVGLDMRVRAEADEDDMVWLDVQVTSSDIVEVLEEVFGGDDESNTAFQIPVISTAEINISSSLRYGDAIAVAGMEVQKKADQEDQSILIVVRAREMALPVADAQPTPDVIR